MCVVSCLVALPSVWSLSLSFVQMVAGGVRAVGACLCVTGGGGEALSAGERAVKRWNVTRATACSIHISGDVVEPMFFVEPRMRNGGKAGQRQQRSAEEWQASRRKGCYSQHVGDVGKWSFTTPQCR